MNLNQIIYRIYDAHSPKELKCHVLNDVRMLIPCAYESILMAAPEETGRLFCDPYCIPGDFCEAEEKYIEMEDVDHLLWTIHSDQPIVIRESQIVSDEQRLKSPIYRKCYGKYNVFDTLQLSLVHAGKFLGVLTLYRTVEYGSFSDEDSFYLQMLSPHLSKMFWLVGNQEGETARRAEDLESLREQYHLTNREFEILSRIFANRTDQEIADEFHISPHTLKKHIQNIYRKLEISSRWELVKYKP